jgi:hypothetical protein
MGGKRRPDASVQAKGTGLAIILFDHTAPACGY